MGRRGRTSSPISLFSFQDIITSVTAIIILMTLMLAVELIHRKLSQAAEAPLSGTPLKGAIAEAENEIKKLQQELEAGSGAALEQAAVTTESLPREIHETKRQAAALRDELNTLRKQESAARQDEQAALAEAFDRRDEQRQVEELEERAENVKQAVAAQTNDNEKKRQRQRELEQRRAQGKKPGERRIYNRPPDAEKQPWLVEVDQSLLRVAPLGRSRKPEEFRGAVFGGPIDAFADWADGLSAASHYFVLLVRPNGIETFDSLVTKLEGRGFDLGFDVIGQDELVLDPEHGAGDDVP